MRAGSNLLRGVAVASALVAAAPAHAQNPAATNAATATAAFDNGRALMKQKRYDEACAAFETSQQLDPQFGTLYNLAGCYAASGKLASAWASYRELEQRDSNLGRRKDAGKRARQLFDRIPHIVVRAPDAPPGLVITLDGSDISGLIGTADPVDLGDHKVHASAPHFKDFESVRSVRTEASTVVVNIQLEPRDKSPGAAAAPSPAVAAAKVEPPGATAAATVSDDSEPHDDGPPRSHRKALAIGVGVTGVALVATGLVFGQLANSKWSDAKALCGGTTTCSDPTNLAAGNQLVDDARSRATLSTVFVIAGGVAVAGGVVLYLTAPSAPAHEGTALRLVPGASSSGVSLTMTGGF